MATTTATTMAVSYARVKSTTVGGRHSGQASLSIGLSSSSSSSSSSLASSFCFLDFVFFAWVVFLPFPVEPPYRLDLGWSIMFSSFVVAAAVAAAVAAVVSVNVGGPS